VSNSIARQLAMRPSAARGKLVERARNMVLL
jgi:hypothetical protein